MSLPVAMFVAYIGLFALFSVLLGNGAEFSPEPTLKLSSDLADLVAVRLAIAKWGVSLVVFAMIGAVLAVYAGRFAAVSLLPCADSEEGKVRLGLLCGILLTLIIFGLLLNVPVSGGLQGQLYTLANNSDDPTLVSVRGVMTLITTITLVPSLAVSLALTALCVESGKPTLARVRRYRNLMKLTAAFLCVGIIQIFLQYNWITGLLVNAELAHDIRSSMTLASAAVYTGLFLSQFLSAAWLLHASMQDSGQSDEGTEFEETLMKTILGDGYLERFRTAALLLSPLITGLFANLSELFH